MNDALTPVIVRIILRYLSGALMSWGGGVAITGQSLLMSPDVEALLTIIIGGLIAAITEWFYAIARRDGGPT